MDKLAIVTGTSRGLGEATALALVRGGWRVLGLARTSACPELRDAAAYHHALIDLSQVEALDAAVDAGLLEVVGAPLARAARVALVNNAARLGPVGPATTLRATDLTRHWALNVAAPVRLAGALLRAVPDGLPLRIVNVSSGAATHAVPGWTAYCSGKAGLALASAVLAAEVEAYPDLAGRDLAVVDYAPNVVATRMQEELRSYDLGTFPGRARFVGLHERGELVAPEGPAAEIAALLERDDLPRHCALRYEPRQDA